MMKTLLRCILVAQLCLLTVVCFADQTDDEDDTQAEQTSERSETLYEQGLRWSETGQLDKALAAFSQAAKQDRNNPNVHNMLAFTKRQLGDLEGAFASYEKALALKPRFPEAREYLGEAHIQALLREVEILQSYGAEGEEALADLIAALRAATVQFD